MTVMRFDPFRQFDRLAEQMLGSARAPRSMPMEAYRRGDQFFIHFDVPGVDPDDVDLTLERNVLTVEAERRSPRQEGDEVLIDELPKGTLTRQLFLGDSLDTERLEAGYDRGVLTLTIPVAEQAKPRRIEISAQSGSPQQVRPSDGGQAAAQHGQGDAVLEVERGAADPGQPALQVGQPVVGLGLGRLRQVGDLGVPAVDPVHGGLERRGVHGHLEVPLGQLGDPAGHSSSSSLGAVVSSSWPSGRTTARSSIRTPPKPGR
jgi:HSP20 family protein